MMWYEKGIQWTFIIESYWKDRCRSCRSKMKNKGYDHTTLRKKKRKKKVTQTIAVKEKRKERSLWIIKFERDKWEEGTPFSPHRWYNDRCRCARCHLLTRLSQWVPYEISTTTYLLQDYICQTFLLWILIFSNGTSTK